MGCLCLTVSQLQEAMRRFVNALDGHPRRNRSRSPPRAMFSTQSEKQKQQGTSYHRASDELKQRMDEARTKEWNNWLGFDACEAQQFLEKNPGVQVVPTRWVDINKARQGEPEHVNSP